MRGTFSGAGSFPSRHPAGGCSMKSAVLSAQQEPTGAGRGVEWQEEYFDLNKRRQCPIRNLYLMKNVLSNPSDTIVSI